MASTVAAALPQPAGDERFVIHDVPWHLYVSLRDSLDERGSKLRLTYLKGRSVVLPDLDLELLAGHAVPGTSLTSAVRAFREALGG